MLSLSFLEKESRQSSPCEPICEGWKAIEVEFQASSWVRALLGGEFVTEELNNIIHRR